jgi:catecholate siderophore receptor
MKAHMDFAYGDYNKAYGNFYAVGWDPGVEEVTLDGYVDSTDRTTITLSGGFTGEFETGSLRHTLVSGVELIVTGNDNDRVNTYFDQSEDDTEVFKLSDLSRFRDGVGVNANGDLTQNNFSHPLAFGDDTRADVAVLSVYIQDEIEVSRHLDVVLGARFDRFDFAVDEYNAVGAVAATRKQVDEEVVPRFGVVYKPEEAVSFYVSYSRSFLPKSGDQFASISRNNLGLDPDAYTNTEAGLKWDIDRKTSLTAAIFGLRQDATETDGVGNFFEVESSVSGFEGQIKANVRDNWFISAGYSYLTGEVIDETDPAVDGARPRELPRHMVSIWNRIHVTERFGFGVGLVYKDKTFITEDNDTVLPSFTRIDAAAYYAFSSDFRLQVNAENLADTIYYPHAHGDHQVSVGAPVNVRVSLSKTF